MAKKLGAAGIQLLVIDTENKFVSTGFAEEIAKAGNGKYYYLPNASDGQIAMAASSAMVRFYHYSQQPSLRCRESMKKCGVDYPRAVLSLFLNVLSLLAGGCKSWVLDS